MTTRKHSAPAAAHPSPNVRALVDRFAEALPEDSSALHGLLDELVDAIWPALDAIDEATASRLRAYLASVRPRRGTEPSGAMGEAIQRGSSLIERLALSARGSERPTLTLSPAEVADVLAFVHFMEPIDPSTWWSDPKEGPSHVRGFAELMYALEHSLRAAAAVHSASVPASEYRGTASEELHDVHHEFRRGVALLEALEYASADDELDRPSLCLALGTVREKLGHECRALDRALIKLANEGRVGQFTDSDTDHTPIAGLPAALPCPFCGDTDIGIEKKSGEEDTVYWQGACLTCTAAAPWGETQADAARTWNRRGQRAEQRS